MVYRPLAALPSFFLLALARSLPAHALLLLLLVHAYFTVTTFKTATL